MAQSTRTKREMTPAERQAAVKLHLAMGILEHDDMPKGELVGIVGSHFGAKADFDEHLDEVYKLILVRDTDGDLFYRRWLNLVPGGGNALLNPTWGSLIAEALTAAREGRFADGELQRLWTSLERRAR